MTYCTIAEIKAVFDDSLLIQLTDDADAGVINDDVITGAINDASAEIDGWLLRRYTLPLGTVPENLRKYAADIVLYDLYCRREGPPDYVAKRYNDAIAYLKLAADGRVSVIADDSDEVSAAVSDFAADNPPRIFTRLLMGGF
jgi:phage gp36-like protein